MSDVGRGLADQVVAGLSGIGRVLTSAAEMATSRRAPDSAASLTAMLREAGFNEPSFHYYGPCAGFWKNMIAVATKPDAARVE